MRARTYASLALMLSLVATPLSALVCGWDCTSPTPQSAAAVASPSAEASCHRPGEASAADFSLQAAPHDCSTHSALSDPAPAPKLPAAGGPLVPHDAGVSLSAVALTGVAASMRAPRDLAPPGRSFALIGPLRI